VRQHAYAERQEAFDAVYHLGLFGLTAIVHEYPADDGREGWVMWEVSVDELPVRLSNADMGDGPALEDFEPDEHDRGRSAWWDDQAEADIGNAYRRGYRDAF
jgi:hypothetical protein